VLDHPDLRLRDRLSQVFDGAGVDHLVVTRHHDQDGFAPALEEDAIVLTNGVFKPATGGCPVGTTLVLKVDQGVDRVHTWTLYQDPLVHVCNKTVAAQAVDAPENRRRRENGNL